MSGHPEDLLRGALEKIVYFECRLSQLEAELAAARDLAAREKEAAASARGREAALEAEMARARADAEDEHTRSAELADRVRLLEGERERVLAGLIDQARIGAAPRPGTAPAQADDERADLAGFIAELRAEVERLRPWKAVAEQAGLAPPDAPRAPEARQPHAAEPIPAVAARFEAAGRLGLAPAEARRLEAQLPTRAERSLYEKSMDDLASADAGARRRAADCLRALGSRAAAPLLAAAVGRERHPEVKAALLAALGDLAEPAAADIARRALDDQRPPVRAAALEALAALAGQGAEPDLLRAFGDPSPLVRRRAALLAGFRPGPAAEEALASALADRDPTVARAAALALSGRPTALAQGALARALDHREPGVRRAAAASVSRWSGEQVDAESPAAERRRASRRIADKLAALGEGTLRDAVVAAAEAPAAPAPPTSAAISAAAPFAAPASPATRDVAPTPAAPLATRAVPAAAPGPAMLAPPRTSPAATAPAGPPVAPAPDVARAAPSPAARVAVAVVDEPGPSDPLEESVVAEIRAALRGRTLDELAAVVPGGRPAAEVALRSLTARGALTRRGARFFAS
ncbi:MAG TPA: HEAT repeat domain-containing protein [Anaeromyxobacteraceae bacterium]|nr:HEAT repeat domain-containing protein [Anaeromyxobacteraceae bacterium]